MFGMKWYYFVLTSRLICWYLFPHICYGKTWQNKSRYDTKHGLFRQLLTVKTFAECPYSFPMSLQLQTVTTVADSQDNWRLSRQLKIVWDGLDNCRLLKTFADMIVLVCSVRWSQTSVQSGSMTMAYLSGKGHGKNTNINKISGSFSIPLYYERDKRYLPFAAPYKETVRSRLVLSTELWGLPSSS